MSSASHSSASGSRSSRSSSSSRSGSSSASKADPEVAESRPNATPSYSSVGACSRAVFWFAMTMIRAARRLAKQGDKLEQRDLYFDEEFSAGHGADLMAKAWEAEGKNPSAIHAVMVGFAGKAWLLQMSLLYLGRCVFHLSEVVFFWLVLQTYSSTTAPLYGTFLFALGVWLACLLYISLEHAQQWGIQKMQVRATAALRALVYRKSLRLADSNGLNAYASIISTEVDSAVGVMSVSFPLLGGLFETLGAFIILWFLVEWSLFVGLGALILVLLSSKLLADAMLRRGKVKGELGGARASMLGEMLAIIRAIKFYAWEANFFKTVAEARRKEAHVQTRVNWLKNLNFMVTVGVPGALAIGVLIPFGAVKSLTLTNAFPALVLLEFLRFALWNAPAQVSQLFDARNASARLVEYLSLPEVPVKNFADKSLDAGAIHLQKATFRFPAPLKDAPGAKDGEAAKEGAPEKTAAKTPAESDSTSPSIASKKKQRDILRDITLKIRPGTLVGIVGEVGSGKTSLALAIVGEMSQQKGDSKVHGPKVAYVPQEAFIINATVKENILFGLPYDAERYARAVETAALLADFKELAQADDTMVGDRGLTVSGGQKQRISLARAIYSDADIVVLDDPLSAVDAHVGLFLFNNCIKGSLRGKTVVFITNQTQYLSQCDSCVALDNGGIQYSGDPATVVRKLGLENDQRGEDSDEATRKRAAEKYKPAVKKEEEKIAAAEAEAEAPKSAASTYIWMIGGPGHLIWGIFLTLLLFGGFICSYLALLGYTLKETTSRINEFNIFVIYFCLMPVAYTLTSLLQGVTHSYSVFKRVNQLHDSLLMRVLRSPMRFFETTPSGNVLAWFAATFGFLDAAGDILTELGLMSMFAMVFFNVVLAVSYPYLLITSVPLMFVFAGLIQFYKPAAGQLKMLQAETAAPIGAHFGETLRGLPSVRAYQAQKIFQGQNEDKINRASAAQFSFYAAEQWIAMVADFAGSVVVLEAALLAAYSRTTITVSTDGTLSLDAARSCVALFFGFALFSISNLFISLQVNLSSVLGAAGGLRAKADSLPQEAAAVFEDEKLPKNWPSKGKIEFQKLELKYRADTPSVLKKISLTIKPGEKVGVVGRTGAGKSSMTAALFRLVEAHSGKILIDGVDVSKLGLDTLRRNLTIVTQDSAMFSGTIRYNLDPFNEYDDKEIKRAIHVAGLDDVVDNLPGGIEAPVSEKGGNFSAGQKQQVALARALLRRPRVLVLDEATSSVDHDTDRKLQAALRAGAEGVTVVTIAHRLNTIMDSDRVLVLDQGNVAEFDSPINLLKKDDSIFHGMVQATGERMAENLFAMADRAERKRNGESVSSSAHSSNAGSASPSGNASTASYGSGTPASSSAAASGSY